MDTPGLDVESVTGMVGGGAQVVVFTTGLGTPTGNPIAPVIKITGNARTAADDGRQHRRRRQRRADDTRIARARGGRGCSTKCCEVASGRPTAAERLGPPRVRDSSPQPDDLRDRAPMAVPTRAARSDGCASRRVSARSAGRSAACCSLAATINYVDRQVIGILKPTLQAQFGWTRSTTATSSSRSSSRTRSAYCSPAG